MKYINRILLPALCLASLPAWGGVRFSMPMEVKYGQVSETVSGKKFEVKAANVAEAIPGAKGNGLRLDGYSNYVEADISLGTLSSFTFSVWCAMETWPIIEHDVQNETEQTCIAGNYDPDAKTGFGFFVSRVGKYSFKFFSGGWPMEVNAPSTLPLYQWNNLVAVADGSKVCFYNNGELLGSSNCRGVVADGKFMIGKDRTDRKMGLFITNTINGIIDEIEIYDEALPVATIQGWTAENEPELNVVSAEMAADLLRPGYHAMPSRNWTNETHGLVKYDGKYHVFFQKNANGPYMSRLQWGHLVSEDLCRWEEMPIAIGSDQWYDLKGCWSGCVAVDDVVTGGKPNLIYTGVDYARAMIGQASPLDNDLLAWSKPSQPIINGRPAGLSDDFRDPYFFRNGDDAYIIVGTSKDGKGACTLHKYNPSNRTWSNDGKIFYSANSVASQGSFWEMPNITKMGDKWLFTVTPLGLSTGVKAMYWTGSINADGTFSSTAWPDNIELPGFAKDGYGLLSPSIMQADGKTVAMGIVPDKLDSYINYQHGWAHAYSLPREWSLDQKGRLVQKPWEGLDALRSDALFTQGESSLNGSVSLGSASQRMAEILGEFVIGDATFGFSFFKNGADCATLTYTPSDGTLTVDFSKLTRIVNDSHLFNGVYTTRIPVTPGKGETMKIHLYIDRSIIDIFVNDKYASSIRVFPSGDNADGLEAFSTGGSTQVKSLRAWTIDSEGQSGIGDITTDLPSGEDTLVDVHTITGALVRHRVAHADATAGLAPGLYLVGREKILVR